MFLSEALMLLSEAHSVTHDLEWHSYVTPSFLSLSLSLARSPFSLRALSRSMARSVSPECATVALSQVAEVFPLSWRSFAELAPET